MKTQKVLKITALSCIAVFALGVLIFGLVTGFGIEDVRALFENRRKAGTTRRTRIRRTSIISTSS